MNKDIERLRKKIDRADDEIAARLVERFKHIGKIASLKKGRITDKKREEEIIDRLVKKATSKGLDETVIKEIYAAIFKASKRYQKRLLKK